MKVSKFNIIFVYRIFVKFDILFLGSPKKISLVLLHVTNNNN